MNFQTAFRDVKPPDKGSFPLDHEAECRGFMARYMRCLRENHSSSSLCRLESKDYLQCRMDRNLMAREEWSKLGYSDSATVVSGSPDTNTAPQGSAHSSPSPATSDPSSTPAAAHEGTARQHSWLNRRPVDCRVYNITVQGNVVYMSMNSSCEELNAWQLKNIICYIISWCTIISMCATGCWTDVSIRHGLVWQ